MRYLAPLVPFVMGWMLLLASDTFESLGLVNGLLQLTLFLLVVCIPAWRTGRMSYVDIGWPWGLVLIGVLAFASNDGHWRAGVVSLVYLFMGGRMALGALQLWRRGKLKQELPRYEYQRIRWRESGLTNERLIMQVEVLMQGLANASFLAMPAFIIASNSEASISGFEIIGLVVWLGAFAMETTADLQKVAFLKAQKAAGKRNQVCNVGLWKYSRHRNYFAEWMVWNALVIAAVPSWLALHGVESLISWGLLGVGLLYTSCVMYRTLVTLTGAVPSEYFSAQKRPDYEDYQRTTNMFFPGPIKKRS